ncbi:MAG: VgrG-related protein [Caldilineaceae bacterium]|nr:VgrG-related protein [Caldilineaceae bacterium]
MNKPVELASQLFVELNGTRLAPEVTQNLQAALVDQHVHAPSMFWLRFADRDFANFDRETFRLADSIEISAKDRQGTLHNLFKGEVVFFEVNCGEGMVVETTVGGYDFSHRLLRNTKTRSFLNVKDSDLAHKIAAEAGYLQVGEIETTSIVHEHLIQNNQSDLEFLQSRAQRIGFECFLQGTDLYFRPPLQRASDLRLVYGQDLIRFNVRISLADQIGEVCVKGWDSDRQAPIIGRADQGALAPVLKNGLDLPAAGRKIGAERRVILHQDLTTQSEADRVAQAYLDELSGNLIQATGVVFRRPDVKAGQIIEIGGLGKRLLGEYLVTRVRHRYGPNGLESELHVTGRRRGFLLETSRIRGNGNAQRGPATAIVTNVDDPKGQGRVKIRYPWLTEELESNWVRVVAPGAGPKIGICVLPSVNDEVMVLFEQDDLNRPYIIGGLWNGVHAPPQADAAANQHFIIQSAGDIDIRAKGDLRLNGKRIDLNGD